MKGPLTGLIGYLNALSEYFDLFQFYILVRAQPTFGWAWALPGLAGLGLMAGKQAG